MTLVRLLSGVVQLGHRLPQVGHLANGQDVLDRLECSVALGIRRRREIDSFLPEDNALLVRDEDR